LPRELELRPQVYDFAVDDKRKEQQWTEETDAVRTQCISAVVRLILAKGSRNELINGDKIKSACEGVNEVSLSH
jgi:hypothetical protein